MVETCFIGQKKLAFIFEKGICLNRRCQSSTRFVFVSKEFAGSFMLTRAYSTKYNECMTFPRCIVLTQYVCVFCLSTTPKAMLFTTLPFPIICFISVLHFLSLSSIFVVVVFEKQLRKRLTTTTNPSWQQQSCNS